MRPDAEEGQYRMLIEEKVATISVGDSGFDFSAIKSSIFNKILPVCNDVVVKTFDTPMLLKGAFDTDSSTNYHASLSAVLTISLIVAGSNIPVRIRGVYVVVTEQKMDEVIRVRVGRAIL